MHNVECCEVDLLPWNSHRIVYPYLSAVQPELPVQTGNEASSITFDNAFRSMQIEVHYVIV